MGLFESALQLIVKAQVTHPPGTLLDALGNPVLDENGEPIKMSQLRQEDRKR